MTSFRDHLDALSDDDDLLSVASRVHWTDAAAVGGEAARYGGPAVRFEETPGILALVSGAYGGPDGIRPGDREPWTRLARALGREATSYTDLLSTVGEARLAGTTLPEADLDATSVDADLYALGLPTVADADRPALTLGLLACRTDDGPRWTPIRGEVRGNERLLATVPRAVAEGLADAPVTVALGVPAAALVAAQIHWASTRASKPPREFAGAVDGFPVAPTAGGPIPAESELVVEGVASRRETNLGGVPEAWELAGETATVEIRVTEVAARDGAVVPFTPAHAPLSDDAQLTAVVEAARLYARINAYWGVEPVEWVALPAAAGLGVCLVASEILYAGFEWQLANALFSFSRLFDKVLVLDETVPPADLPRALDDMWVRAHPSHDWEFGEPAAPPATAPVYRRDGTTGSRLYINATWDPRWDETYIAPRVTFDSSFPNEVRETVRERWHDLGFENPFPEDR